MPASKLTVVYSPYMTPDSEARADALAFAKAHTAGVLATVAKDYSPHASVIYYVSDETFNIYFLTKRGSRKYNAIKAHPQVAFTVGTQDTPRTLQIEGLASELESTEDREKHIPDLMNVLSQQTSRFVPAGKLDGELSVLWIRPTWIRWADFSKKEIGNENLLVEIPVE